MRYIPRMLMWQLGSTLLFMLMAWADCSFAMVVTAVIILIVWFVLEFIRTSIVYLSSVRDLAPADKDYHNQFQVLLFSPLVLPCLLYPVVGLVLGELPLSLKHGVLGILVPLIPMVAVTRMLRNHYRALMMPPKSCLPGPRNR